MVDYKSFVKAAKDFIVKNAPTILTCAGIVGSVTAVGLAINETPKALEKIDEAKDNKLKDKNGNYIITAENYDNSLNAWEMIKTVAPVYWPMALTEVTALSCIIFSNSMNLKRQAALFAAYQLSENNLKDYKAKMIETFGEKKSKEVEDKISQNKVLELPPVDQDIINTGAGLTLCFDAVSGRYYYSDIERVKQAINDMNRRLLSEREVCLNEFYAELNLPSIGMGDMLGWNKTDLGDFLECEPRATITEKGKPCIVFDYDVHPLYSTGEY